MKIITCIFFKRNSRNSSVYHKCRKLFTRTTKMFKMDSQKHPKLGKKVDLITFQHIIKLQKKSMTELPSKFIDNLLRTHFENF